jgi:hypothetical protein
MHFINFNYVSEQKYAFLIVNIKFCKLKLQVLWYLLNICEFSLYGSPRLDKN